MAISKINPSNHYNVFRTIAKHSRAAYSIHDVFPSGVEAPFNMALENNQQEPDRGSWATGTGVVIDTDGSVIFNAEASGAGILTDVIIANKGGSTLYVGVNSINVAVGSGLALASGESINIDGAVRQIWGITSGGSTVMHAYGTYFYNINSI